MKILITGHEGFIGSNLLKYLNDLGYEVIGLDIKSGNDILICDLPECDLVIHLAGIGGVRESINDPNKYWHTNVDGTRRILEYYKDKRVLVAGSSSQYEPHLNPYAASKYIIEKIPHNNVVFMRFHTVYGPNPRKEMFFDKLLNNTLEYVTDHERDFIHIDDVCKSVTLLITANFIGPIDIGTGISTKITSICSQLPINYNTNTERKITRANTTQLTKLGYTAKIKINDFLNSYNIKVL
jgi:nucleoside-diphosphate-sugar epimerase